MPDFIDAIRQDPENFVSRLDVFFDFRGATNAVKDPAVYEEGTSCTMIAHQQKVRGVVTVGVENGGRDYFFPWIPRGVGAVKVPAAAPDGTIVATGQLNGCTFEAIRVGSDIWFYHDGDSKFLRRTVQPVVGQTVCVVAPNDYMPLEMGITIMGITQKLADTVNDPTKTRAYCHQLFVVRHSGVWKVFNCGLLLFNGEPTEGFRDSASKLVGTF